MEATACKYAQSYEGTQVRINGSHGGNFVKTMLRLSETYSAVQVVADQVRAPTYTEDLAPLLCGMVQTERYGTYHATNEGGVLLGGVC